MTCLGLGLQSDFKRLRDELSKVKDIDLRRDLARGGEMISYQEDNATSDTNVHQFRICKSHQNS
ncbi:MAG: hypothetical protein ACHQXG_03270 [Nitrososphaerales archaeon]